MSPSPSDRSRPDPGLVIIAAPTTAAVRASADAACARAREAGVRVTRLLTDARQAALVKQRLADDGARFLGMDVSTLNGWVQDRWVLFGDGRLIVNAAQRRALVLRALAQDAQGGGHALRLSAGMARYVEDIVKRGSGAPSFETPDLALLSGAQRHLIQVCHAYEELLERHGLIEPGLAAALLPQVMDDAGWSHLVVDGVSETSLANCGLIVEAARRAGADLVVRADAPGTPRERRAPALGLATPFVARMRELCDEARVPARWGRPADAEDPWRSDEVRALAAEVFRPTPGRAIAPAGDVRFALPSGAYATPEAVAQAVEQLVARGIRPREIAIACGDPVSMADALAGRLAAAGVGCTASATAPVERTAVARAVLGLARLVRAEAGGGRRTPAPELRPLASDLARNPTLGVETRDALALDAAWRSDRGLSACDFLTGIADASRRAADAIESLRAGDVAAAILRLSPGEEARTGRAEDSVARTAADADERRAASTLLRQVTQADAMGVDALAWLDQLAGGVVIPTSRLYVPPTSLAAQLDANVLASNPDVVHLMRLRDTEGLVVRAVIVCDLEAQPQIEEDDPFGLTMGASIVDQWRWQFSCALEAASEVLVLERCLADADANALRPSLLFEEVVDCYRPDVTATDDLDRQTGLPAALAGALPVIRVGEERFSQVVAPAPLDRATTRVPVPELALDGAVACEMLADPAAPLSPSAVEAYLRCPARWFFERRVPSSGLDTAFDALAVGSFSHAVLYDFHERLPQRTRLDRISPGDRDDPVTRLFVEELLNECFDHELRREGDPAERVQNRLVAVGQTEAQRLQRLRENLTACVWRDALMPAGFVPTLAEWSFGFRDDETGAVPYAGALLRGRLDRVDADADGRALVIDYKGSLAHGYALPRARRGDDRPPDPDALPLHTQALMYLTALGRAGAVRQAQAVDTPPRALTPVGAVYVSYDRPVARGFVDRALGAAARDLLDDASIVTDDFGDDGIGLDGLLARTERVCADALANLFDGDIEPAPRFGADSCAGCPVPDCWRRMA
ncbi:PD-(D/E)XK nuclease family protein [bacterium]|nr:PD-(D/E)XK nuclease family protein [bacterium]